MFCPACGASIPEGSKFCSACGANAGGGPAAPAVSAPAAVASELEYYIRGVIHQVAEVHLAAGQRMYSETGAMIWMDPSIELETTAPDQGKGLLGALTGAVTRAIAGESLFLNFFTAKGGPGRVSFAASFPGKIIDLRLEPGQSLIGQRGAFLAAQDTCQLKMEVNRNVGSGLFGGEGFFLQRITGPGTCFLEIDGELTILDLEPGQMVRVDSGHIAAFQETVVYDIQFQSLKNVFISGEGLALATLTGPGRVWLQHQTIPSLARDLIPFLPFQHK
jgi:uncharacterized protein (TIGR00266 family)